MRRLFLLAGIWGWSFLFIKVAVGGMPPAAVAFARVALGMVVLLAVVRLRGLRLPAGREAWRHFAIVGLFGSALPFTLLAWGEQHIASALAAVLNAATPLFAARPGGRVPRPAPPPQPVAGPAASASSAWAWPPGWARPT